MNYRQEQYRQDRPRRGAQYRPDPDYRSQGFGQRRTGGYSPAFDRDRGMDTRSRSWPDYDREYNEMGTSYDRDGRGWEMERGDTSRQQWSDRESGDMDRERYDFTKGSERYQPVRFDSSRSVPSRYEQGGFTGKGPKGYRRSDERIKEDICEELSQHPDIDASEIEVKVQNGEVVLTGTVKWRQCKRMAEDIAEQVSGVQDVRNEIRVQVSAESSQKGKPTMGTGMKSAEARTA